MPPGRTPCQHDWSEKIGKLTPNPGSESHVAEQLFGVPLPSALSAQGTFPSKVSRFVSTSVSWDNSFLNVRQAPLLDPGRGPPSCNDSSWFGQKCDIVLGKMVFHYHPWTCFCVTPFLTFLLLTKKMYNMGVTSFKFYLGQNEGGCPGDITSESSERLLPRGKGEGQDTRCWGSGSSVQSNAYFTKGFLLVMRS